MSQSDAWRYRPLAQELRTRGGSLRRRWSLTQDTAARDAARLQRERNRVWNEGRSNTGYWGNWRGPATLALPQAYYDAFYRIRGSDESDVRRSGGLAPPRDDWRRGQPAYSGGSYDPGSAPFRTFDVGTRRPPKPTDGWDPSPWPTAAGGGGGGGDSRAGKIRGTIRYERF